MLCVQFSFSQANTNFILFSAVSCLVIKNVTESKSTYFRNTKVTTIQKYKIFIQEETNFKSVFSKCKFCLVGKFVSLIHETGDKLIKELSQ